MGDAADPAMVRAMETARATFPLFWRELHWEYRRIIPAFGMTVVKFPFSDSAGGPVEQMWVTDLQFDGVELRGTLMNKPNQLRSVRQGSAVQRPWGELSDWMYTSRDQAWGGFTVAALRATMSQAERTSHDDAWGLDFGPPESPRVPARTEHPMALNMGPSLNEHLQKRPGDLTAPDEFGLNMFHALALSGSPSLVSAALAFKPDVKAKTNRGLTARDLAHAMGWTEVVAVLDRV